MTRQIFSFAAAAFFTLSLSTAWAQEGRPGQDTGPSGPPAGPSGGGGNPAGSGGGGGVSSSSSGGGGSVSSGGSSSSGPSNTSAIGGSSWGEGRSSDSPRMAAPMRGPMRGGGDSSYSEGQRAVPRGSAGSGGGESRGGATSSGGGGGERTGRAVPRGEGGGRISGRGDAGAPMSADGPSDAQRSAPERGAIPSYSRPREGRTAVGSAVDRSEAPRPNYGVIGSYFDPYFGFYGYGNRGYYGRYSRYGSYGFPGYGYGLGYFYDPFWYDPFYDPYSGGGYGYGGYGGGGGGRYYQGRGYDTGSLRLKVAPRDAKVYVDGYFVGVVDSFDGVFQRLAIESGSHRVEIRADGYEPAQFEVMITPGETITYKGELKRAGVR